MTDQSDWMTVTRREAVGVLAGGALALAAPRALAGAPADANALKLWYRKPAQQWVEALPVGNGRLGAMVFGGIERERLQLNEDTLWGGGPYNPVNPDALKMVPEVRRLIFEGKYAEAEAMANAHVMAKPLRQMSYQALGDLFLEMPGLAGAEVTDYRRELDIDAAVATTTFSAGGIDYKRRVVASPLDQVIAVHISADRGIFDLAVSFATPQKAASVAAEGADTLVLAGINNAEHGIAGALRFEARAHVQSPGAALSANGDRLTVKGAKAVTILIAMATSYRRYDDVSGDPTAVTRSQIEKTAGRSFEQIAEDASAEHRRLFRRVAIDLGTSDAATLPTDERVRQSQHADDPSLAALYYQFGRYLLIASSRPGTQPANLQGIWNESIRPPWGSKYTININTEMNYWPAEPTNLAECTEPLLAMVRDLAETGARTAREMYGARGWVVHHNTDLWRATAPIDGAKYGLWPTGGAWLCTHLWDRYDYGRDKAFLAQAYPLMRGSALFFLDTLVADPKSGWLVTNPSLSPENNHGHGSSLCAGPAMDMQILRDLFDQVATAAGILGTDREFAQEVTKARARLAPSRVGRLGQLQEWQEDWDADAEDVHHRHVSHLYALFPSNQITVDRTPELANAARRSLELRGDKATGWATAWRINLWARLRDGDRAHSILRFLLGPERTYPNLFDAHPPFQIDGNFGGTAGITEMLMQSDGEAIRLLPALPTAWPTGSIVGLRARGGCSVSLGWRNGRLDWAQIGATVATRQRVHLGNRTRDISLKGGQTIRLAGAELRLA